MDILLAVAALLMAIVGIVGCIVPVLPGPVLSYAALLLCYFGCDNSEISTTSLWIWALVTLVVSLVDYVLPGYLTKLFGGSRSSVTGATIGVFAGFLIFPPIGIILCPFVGAVIGEMLHDSRNLGRALLAGIGSFFAFVAGTGIKLVASICIMIVIVADLVPIVKAWFA